jgi:hypothetical protein
MTAPEHDDEFELYLKRRLPIHQRISALERLEPPEDLDRIVITKARQAIQSPSPVRIFRAPKWALPVGLAATIIISFTVLLHLGVHAVKPQRVHAVTDLTTAKDTTPHSDMPKTKRREMLAESATAAAPPAAGPPVRTQSTAVADAADHPVPRLRPDLETWLKQIEKLRAAGRTTEAEQEFRRFRDAYPDYKAPAGPPPADGPTQ